MPKQTIHLTIDVDLVETAKVRRFKDPSFSISSVVNDFLRDLFGQEISTLEKDKLEMEIAEMEQKLALKKSQISSISSEKKRKTRVFWKKKGYIGEPIPLNELKK